VTSIDNWLQLPTTALELERVKALEERRRALFFALVSACGYALIASLSFEQGRVELEHAAERSHARLEEATKVLDKAARAEEHAFSAHRGAVEDLTRREALRAIAAQALNSTEREHVLRSDEARQAVQDAARATQERSALEAQIKQLDAQRATDQQGLAAAERRIAEFASNSTHPVEVEPRALEQQRAAASDAVSRDQKALNELHQRMSRLPAPAAGPPEPPSSVGEVRAADADYSARIRDVASASGEEARTNNEHLKTQRELEERQRLHGLALAENAEIKRSQEAPAQLELPLLGIEVDPAVFSRLAPVLLIAAYGYLLLLVYRVRTLVDHLVKSVPDGCSKRRARQVLSADGSVTWVGFEADVVMLLTFAVAWWSTRAAWIWLLGGGLVALLVITRFAVHARGSTSSELKYGRGSTER
jgi:hypothetical protein